MRFQKGDLVKVNVDASHPEYDFGKVLSIQSDRMKVRWEISEAFYWEDVNDPKIVKKD